MMLYNLSGEKLQCAVLKSPHLIFENGTAIERFRKKKNKLLQASSHRLS